ncbi:MAG: alpha/beta fold hydrolase [Acidobacteria bacterium]|nr:alpha/beta fold hydrolase [Acidobacteriota bacterium]
MGRTESVDFRGPAGRLEGNILWPEGRPVAAAVVCHAHPLHGGIMHFKVVYRAAKALQAQGLAVLRFNFRGVGRSDGAHDNGDGEQNDARAAISEILNRLPDSPIVLGGFSFGSAIALRVGVGDSRAHALMALGFPISLMADTSFLVRSPKPTLFVQGDRDEFGDGESIRRLVSELPGECSLDVIPECDHFFSGHLDRLHTAVARWAAARPWSRRESEPAACPGSLEC